MNIPQIPPDGKVHRFKGASRNGASGWAVNFGGHLVVGDWATGEKEVISDKGNRVSGRTKRMLIKRVLEDKVRAQEEAARICYEIWQSSIECYEHPYLTKKKVDSFDLRLHEDKIREDHLLIPLHDIDGQIWSLQYIDKNGKKLFYKNGRKKGLFYLIGDWNDPLVVCEGYATGASIRMATQVCVAVAFDAGNLFSVVAAIREKEPYRRIWIAADNDCWKPHLGNPGVKHAEECHYKFGCWLIVPSFKNTDTKPTDFNDLHCLEGIGVVHDQIMKVIEPCNK